MRSLSKDVARVGGSVAAKWVMIMSGVLALIREVFGLLATATGRPLPAGRAFEVFVGCSRIAFVVSLLLVWYANRQRLASTEQSLLKAQADLAAKPSTVVLLSADARTAVVPIPRDPSREYLRDESGPALLHRYGALRWNERRAVAEATIIGRWLRGQAILSDISPSKDKDYIYVGLRDPESTIFLSWGSLIADGDARSQIHELDLGDLVEYEAAIDQIATTTVTLKLGTIRRVTKSDG